MSRDLNKVILIGRLARDPEVRVTQGGTRTARFSLACGREWKDKATGEKRSEVDFHPVQVWGETAGILEKYCRKGKQIVVEGRLHSYSYDDRKTGGKRWVTEVVADSIILLASPPSPQGTGTGAARDGGTRAGGQSAPVQPEPRFGSLRDEDDIPPLDFSDLGGGIDDIEMPF